MKNNLEFQLDWLRSNLQFASVAGFEKLKDKRNISNENCIFSFENLIGGNQTSTVSSVGAGGNYDLEKFRISCSPMSLKTSYLNESGGTGHCNNSIVEESIPDNLLLEIDLTGNVSFSSEDVTINV